MDFHQDSPEITTLHYLKDSDLKGELIKSNANASLIIPSLYDEIKRPAIQKYKKELDDAKYLSDIIVVLNGTKRKRHFDEFKDFFSDVKNCKIMWIESEDIQQLYKEAKKYDLFLGEKGKGNAFHKGIGYSVAKNKLDNSGNNKKHAIGTIDADILTFSSDMLDRMFYPVMEENFEFNKGYYSRHTDEKFNGRVTRLLYTPLIWSMEDLEDIKRNEKAMDFLAYKEGFRYPLAGEMVFLLDLLKKLQVAYDWSMESAFITEAYNSCPGRIAQTCVKGDGGYDHKHSSLSPMNKNQGLHRMAREISKYDFRVMARYFGVSFNRDNFLTLGQLFEKNARKCIDKYEMDTKINDIKYNRHNELLILNTFSKAVHEGMNEYLKYPRGDPVMPAYERIEVAFPDFLERLFDSVNKNNSPNLRHV